MILKYTLKTVKSRKSLGEYVNIKKARADAYKAVKGFLVAPNGTPVKVGEVIIEDENKAIVGKVIDVKGQPVFRKDGERDFAVNADGSMSAIKGEPVRPGKKKEKREREGSRFGPFHLVDFNGFSVAESASRKGILATAYRMMVDSGFKKNTFVVTDKDMVSMGTVFGFANEGKVYLRADGERYVVDEDGNYTKFVPKKAVTVNDTEGDYVIAVRNDNTGSVRFMGRGGLTSNPKYALKYSKKTASTEVKSDKAKAGIVAKRLNKERPSMSSHEYFVTELEYGTKLNDKGKERKDYDNPLRIKGSKTDFDIPSRTPVDEGRYVVIEDGKVVTMFDTGDKIRSRSRNLNGARKNAVWMLHNFGGHKVTSLVIAQIVGGISKPIGVVKLIRERGANGEVETFQWWTRKVITKPAYDVKGRRVQGSRYVIVVRFTLDAEGKPVKQVRRTEDEKEQAREQARLEEMQREFAKAGINFIIDPKKR